MTFLLFKFSKWKKNFFLKLSSRIFLEDIQRERILARVDQRNCLRNKKQFFQSWLHEGHFVASIFGDWELLLTVTSSTKSLRILTEQLHLCLYGKLLRSRTKLRKLWFCNVINILLRSWENLMEPQGRVEVSSQRFSSACPS